MSATNHKQDSDCTVGSNDCCIECGVMHGTPCPDCGGKGFHNPGCEYYEEDETMDKAQFVLCWEDGSWTTEYFDIPNSINRYDGKPDFESLHAWAMGGGLGMAYRKAIYICPVDW